MMKTRSVVLFCLLLASGPAICLAAEGRIPIFEATTITQPGSYFVSNDILSATCDVITIAASVNNVTIDLDGHTIVPGNLAGCSGVTGTDVSDIHILNGKIIGGGVGIRLSGASGEFGVRDVSLLGSSGSGIRIIGGTIATGFCETIARAVVVGNTVDAGNGAAMAAIYLSCIEGSRVELNQVRSSKIGINLEDCKDSVVKNNLATRNTDYGIQLLNSSQISVVDNVATSNDQDGINLINSYDNILIQNSASNNRNGIVMNGSANNSILHNNASRNTQTGLLLVGSSSNNIAYNTTSGNQNVGGIVLTNSNHNSLSNNNASGNSKNGISMTSSSNNSLDWNQCAGNTGTTPDGMGISVNGQCNVLSNNRTQGNATGGYAVTYCPGPPYFCALNNCSFDAGSNF